MPKYTYRSEWVKCGKKGCGSCPHGPYWYAYWREGGKTRKRYIGKGRDPREPEPVKAEDADPLDAIFGARTATAQMAWSILGIEPTMDYYTARRQFRKEALRVHPDRCSGVQKPMMRLNAAWDFLCKKFGW